MAKFIFNLQSFLNIKEKLEQQKRTEYGNAISKLEKENLILKNIFLAKEKTIISIKENSFENINFNSIKKFNSYLSFLENEIISQSKVIENEQKNVEEARRNLIEAMKEREILESLKEKKKEEFLKEELKKEQKSLDEIISFKYNIKP